MSDPPAWRDANAVGVEFLLTDLETALTFMDVAATSEVEETTRRNHENARRAYDTVVRLLRNLHPTEAEQRELDERLSALKARLQAVGQQF
jgi:hypothetical protein